MREAVWLLKTGRWAAFVCLVVLTLTGCITPQVTVQPGVKLEAYRKVYFLVDRNDPRAVNPRVLSRLQKAGFQVVEIKPDVPPVDMQGSGFIISPQGHVLTCAHVVENSPNATIWVEGKRYPCRVLAADTNLDLAVLQVDGEHQLFRPLRFNSGTNYSLGQDVFVLGFPLAEVLGTSPRLNKGLVSATVGMGDDPKYFQFSAPVQPGNSGGPLLNSQSEVVGVAASTLNPMKVLMRSGGDLPQNVNFAIKLSFVREFLLASKIPVPSGDDGKATSTFDEAEKSIALVRVGNVTDEELKQPSMVCAYGYLSFFDMWFRFRYIQISFFDTKSGNLIFKVGQYHDDPFSSEDGELDRIFVQISANFFPNLANPFKGK